MPCVGHDTNKPGPSVITVGIIHWNNLEAGFALIYQSKSCGAHSQENTKENQELLPVGPWLHQWEQRQEQTICVLTDQSKAKGSATSQDLPRSTAAR